MRIKCLPVCFIVAVLPVRPRNRKELMLLWPGAGFLEALAEKVFDDRQSQQHHSQIIPAHVDAVSQQFDFMKNS